MADVYHIMFLFVYVRVENSQKKQKKTYSFISIQNKNICKKKK